MVETRTDQVVRCVEELIKNQGLNPGDLLPTYRELVNLCGVSETTVARGILILKARGVVHGQAGKRLFVGPGSESRGF